MADQIYSQKVTSTGGGRDGHIKGDGAIDFDVTAPKGDGVNPESLLAGAWAACFNGALQKTMGEAGVDTDKHQPEVDAEVALNDDGNGGFVLSGKITARFANKAELDNADELVAKAHDFCPFSKALRGDIEIEAVAG